MGNAWMLAMMAITCIRNQIKTKAGEGQGWGQDLWWWHDDNVYNGWYLQYTTIINLWICARLSCTKTQTLPSSSTVHDVGIE